MIDNFTPQPYPLYAVHDYYGEELVHRVIGWQEMQPGEVYPVIWAGDRSSTLDCVAVRLLDESGMEAFNALTYLRNKETSR